MSYDKITVNGQEFYLVPCFEIDSIDIGDNNVLDGYSLVEEEDKPEIEEDEVINDFPERRVESPVVPTSQSLSMIKPAQGVVSDYRERFKKRQIRLDELRTTPSMPQLPQDISQPTFNKISSQADYEVFFGEGLQYDEQ